jgi:phytanoyl-CoA hydroxylase
MNTPSIISQQLQPAPAYLSAQHIEQCRQDGFIAFKEVLSTQEVETCKAALSELVQRVANGQSEKKGSFWTLPGRRFGVQFEAGYQPQSDDLAVELKVRKLMWYADQHPHLHFCATQHPRIKGVLESLLGPHPVMFQDMALVKPPFIGSEKPWHQDNAYFSVTPLESIIGVWIALDEATVANGCMHVLPGGHRLGAMKHYHGRDCEIVPQRVDESQAIAVPLPPGGAMFFYGMLPHQTPPNSSPHRRRALQFHYRSANSRIVPREEYDRIYAESDGTPASCAAAAEQW